MSGTRNDQRKHRKKVAGTPKGLAEHKKREKRRGKNRTKTKVGKQK